MLNWLRKLLGRPEPGSVARAPRVRLMSVQGVSFHPDPELNLGSPVLADVSASGLAFQNVSFFRPVKIGDQIPGMLKVRDKEFEVTVEIVRSEDDVVAGPFHDVSIGLAEALTLLFGKELEAVRMKRIDPNVMKQPATGQAVWLRSGNAELYVHTDENKVLSFQLGFFGFYVELEEDKPLFIGSNPPREDSKVKPHPSDDTRTDLLTKSDDAQVAVLKLAIPFVNNAHDCPAWIRGVIVSQLNRELSNRMKAH
jgi:hypothetical protein